MSKGAKSEALKGTILLFIWHSSRKTTSLKQGFCHPSSNLVEGCQVLESLAPFRHRRVPQCQYIRRTSPHAMPDRTAGGLIEPQFAASSARSCFRSRPGAARGLGGIGASHAMQCTAAKCRARGWCRARNCPSTIARSGRAIASTAVRQPRSACLAVGCSQARGRASTPQR